MTRTRNPQCAQCRHGKHAHDHHTNATNCAAYHCQCTRYHSAWATILLWLTITAIAGILILTAAYLDLFGQGLGL